jgi:outer membrane lipoprotein-sorting protein
MKKSKLLMPVVAILILTGFSAQQPDATAILKKLDKVMFSAKDMTARTKIILIDKNGKQKIREAEMKQKGTDKRLFRFTAPASQAGIATLSLPDDVMYVYMPAYGKERRISSSVKSQKFAGTDFSYDDMEAKEYSSKYSAKYLRTEGNLYVLELTPVSKKSTYLKLIIKIDKVNYYPTYTAFYDKGNHKIKEAKYTFKKIGKYWNASVVEMKDLKKNHRTKMIMSDVKYDSGLSDDIFTVRNLKS